MNIERPSAETQSVSISRPELGRKGNQTRRRLMDAALELLVVASPVALTVAGIARKARTSPATFYVYFEDVGDLILALAREASTDLADVHSALQAWRDGLGARAGAQGFVHAFRAYYRAHRAILSIRNMEGDRGDERFLLMRSEAARPILAALALLIGHGRSSPRASDDAMGRAIVIYAAIERLATAEIAYRPSSHPTPLSSEGIADAQIAMLAELVDPNAAT